MTNPAMMGSTSSETQILCHIAIQLLILGQDYRCGGGWYIDGTLEKIKIKIKGL